MRPLPVLLLLAACARPDQRYAGPLTPDASSAQCRPGTATLVLRGGDAVFTPDEGTWSLTGPTANQTLQASRAAPRGGQRTQVDARWDGAKATGTYVTSRCTFRFTLAPR